VHFSFLFSSVADPDPGSSAFQTPGFGIRDGKIRIWDKHLGSYFRKLVKIFLGLKILKFFAANPDPGSGAFLIRGPGWKNSDPESRINIADQQQELF
jgi:hypothetical protein